MSFLLGGQHAWTNDPALTKFVGVQSCSDCGQRRDPADRVCPGALSPTTRKLGARDPRSRRT